MASFKLCIHVAIIPLSFTWCIHVAIIPLSFTWCFHAAIIPLTYSYSILGRRSCRTHNGSKERAKLKVHA